MEEEMPEAASYGSYEGFRAKLAYHFEGLIPLIIIVIFIAIAGHWLGFWTIPFLGKPPVKMLIIGRPSDYTLDVLNKSRDLVVYRIREASTLAYHPEYVLANYDIVMLDQTNSEDRRVYGPIVPRQLGDALNEYVRKGGKLIIVQDSGIMDPNAPEAIGWLANLGKIAPVECIPDQYGKLSCLEPITIRGRIRANILDHPIMQGIEVAPPVGEPYYLTVFNIGVKGKEIAYIQDEDTGDTYPGIVESSGILGKVIYFNYDPGITPKIFINTIKYLK